MPTQPDPPALAELLVHSKWMSALARRLASDPADADDLVQDVWVRAVQSPPIHRRALRSWLARVLSRMALDARRGEERRRGHEARYAEDASPLPTVPGSDELAERLDTQRILAEELMQIPEPYRATVLLVYYQGLAPSDVARVHGVPAGTARWRLKQGLDTLRERVRGRLGPDAVGSLFALGRWGQAPGGAAVAAEAGLAPAAAGAVKIAAAAALLVAASATAWLALDPVATQPVGPPASTPAFAVAGGSEVELGLEGAGAAPLERRSLASATREGTGERTLALTTRFVDEAGEPLAGVSVEFVWEALQGLGSGQSGSDGQVLVSVDWDGLSEKQALGTRRFLCSLAGRALHLIEAPLTRDRVTHLPDVVLVPECRVSGRVLDVDGKPLAGEQVRASASNGAVRDLADEGGTTTGPSYGLGPGGVTDAGGRFLLTQVPPGFVRAWAGGDERRYAYSRRLELESGDSAEVELVIEDYAPTDLMEGVVQDASGRKLAGIYVKARYESDSGSGTLLQGTDEAGHFRFVLPAQASYELRAFDPDPASELLPVDGLVVEPGRRDLVLVLEAPRRLALHLVDTSGEPVEEFDVYAQPEIASALRWTRVDRERLCASGAHPGGEEDVGVPADPFHLRLVAEGYRPVELGPLTLSTIESPLEVKLERVATIRGRVLAAGKPVARASVELLAVPEPDTEYLPIRHHMPCVVDHHPVAVAKTDEEGAFHVDWNPGQRASELSIFRKGSDRYRTDVARIRVTADGFAPAFLTERAVTALAAEELEIELSQGGVLEGRVLVEEGFGPVGTIVAVTDGDGHPASTRAGEDGTFRFQRLTPGDWIVWTHDEDLDDHSGSSGATSAKDFSFAALADCHIVDGKTTQYVLDLRGRVCRFDGRITIEGIDLSGIGVDIDPVEHVPGDDLRGVVPAEAIGAWIDAEGRFACDIRRGRSYELAVDREGLWVRDTLKLDAPAFEWRLDVPCGSLSIEQADAGELALFHLVVDGARSIATALPVVDGRVPPTRVPAGEGQVVRGYEHYGRILPERPPSACKVDTTEVTVPKTLQVLATVAVEAGEVTALDSLGGS